jgi:hypothetical protein
MTLRIRLPFLLPVLLPFSISTVLVLFGCGESHAPGDAGGDSGRGDGAVPDARTDGGATDYYACEYVTDCVLSSRTCCGVCGRPTASDVESVNSESVDAYWVDVACPESVDPMPIVCPECAQMPNPNLVPACDARPDGGRCVVLDIETPTYATCSAADDCMIRASACCECGADVSPGALVAISRDSLSSYLAAVCDPRADCAACAPIYPDDVTADCVGGLCQVVLP